eukprot:scaffold13104_cov18-Tisochrysis_lutea.AAC.3
MQHVLSHTRARVHTHTRTHTHTHTHTHTSLTVNTQSRPRLSQLVVSPSTVAAAAAQQQQQHYNRGGMGGSGALLEPRPRLLQRPSGAEGQRNGPETDRQPVARSAKDREE